MMRFTFLILIVLSLASCYGSSETESQAAANDSTATEIDTLVSDVNWDDEFGDEEYTYDYEEESSSSSRSSSSGYSSHSGGAAGGTADDDADVIKYQNYERSGDSPKDFATALIYPAIRMVYSDNFANPRVTVNNATQDGDRHNIDLTITWKDHWVPKYRIDGTLMVNSDGSDANFVITDKNVDAEVLELTEDNFETEITLPAL
jgi:hypothetical protein